MIAKFFIERPIFANVIAVLTIILGLVALARLPVAQYPNIVPPTVQVTARYPGASASTVVRDVGLPIEQKVNGVEGMIYMSSMSTSDGTYTLTVTFKIGTDADKAQILVQNRVSSALPALPSAVQTQGVQTAKRSTSILEIVALSSDGRYDSLFLSNYATINLVDELARVDGVGNVSVFGAGQYAMRLWLDPQKMQVRKLVPADVINAVNLQSRSTGAGQLGLPPVPAGQTFQYTINVPSKLDDVTQFEDIIIKADTDGTGRITRLRDVATVELGAQQYSQTFKLNGQPSAGVAVFQLPEANALDVAKRVEQRMGELQKAFPQGMTWNVPFDTTKFVGAAIHEVYKTLIEAAILVLIVILVFLQNWRATLVPATTVPVTIIGAFAAMAVFGFTVNLTTLFAIILAIGIVVDDAIVVVEGAAKHIEQGLSPHDATVKAMDELLGPIIGITLVLMAVFVPAAFLPGLSGQMYRQFAMVIAATAAISAINALTLKPAQCALWMRPSTPPEQRNIFYRAFNRVYDATEARYAGLIARMVARSGLMALIVAGARGTGRLDGLSRVPTAFLPIEDQGYFLIAVQLPEGASLERTTRALDEVTKRVREQPGVDKVVAIGGLDAINDSASLANAGIAYVILKDWSERGKKEDLLDLYLGLSERVKTLDDGIALVIPPPPIQGIGNVSGATMKVELRDGSFDYAQLEHLAQAIVERASSQSAFQVVRNSFRADAPQLNVTIDRVKSETLGVPLGNALDALSSFVGSTYVGQFNKFGRVFQIYVQAEAAARLQPESLKTLMVRNTSGGMVPLGTLADITSVSGPSLVSLYNLYPAATVVANTARGFSSGQGLDLLEQIAKETLPRTAGFDWTAMSYQEKEIGNQIYLVYALSLLLVYLVLAAQYESWFAPVTVIVSVPLALLGTAAALTALGVPNNLYTQIGLILLIALSAKNAILIVEFARELRRHGGHAIEEAAVMAARNRFRPILMTSFAFILGVVPLVLGTGAGANAQKSIGIAVLTGMLGSTLLTVAFVPSVFVVLQRFEEWRAERGKKPVVQPAA